MKLKKTLILAGLAAVASGAWFCIPASSQTNGTIRPLETSPERIAQLMAEFETFRTNISTTEWIGCPMTSDDDKYTPRQGWVASVEIGLRSDGIVVWRARK